MTPQNDAAAPPILESLPRDQLLAVAHEYMLSGMLVVKAIRPIMGFQTGLDEDTDTALGIDQWMGASPIYTKRMRSLMRIEGDDVTAIMKALQLDVGFVHQYMDVAYEVQDEHRGEFWLRHCGALLDVEPFGEDRVFNMCHTIEDPTFDATALATNPRARIRPIHRPPRASDSHPHCHWTITIDPEVDPVGAVPLNALVAALPLATLPNVLGTAREPDLLTDYAGSFRPEFRLRDLATGTLAAVSREFQIQSHMLIASIDLAMRPHVPTELKDAILDESWLGAAWISAERLGRVRALQPDPTGLAEVLALTPLLPPGFDREVTSVGDQVQCRLVARTDGLLDVEHPGWCGTLAHGATAPFEGTARGLGLGVDSIAVRIDDKVVEAVINVSAAPSTDPEPDVVAIGRIGRTATWDFGQSVQIRGTSTR